MRVDAEKSQICFDCHAMANWELSAHGNPADPRFSEINDLACAQCHNIHAVPAQSNLLIADENSLCMSCHDGMKNTPKEVSRIEGYRGRIDHINALKSALCDVLADIKANYSDPRRLFEEEYAEEIALSGMVVDDET